MGSQVVALGAPRGHIDVRSPAARFVCCSRSGASVGKTERSVCASSADSIKVNPRRCPHRCGCATKSTTPHRRALMRLLDQSVHAAGGRVLRRQAIWTRLITRLFGAVMGNGVFADASAALANCSRLGAQRNEQFWPFSPPISRMHRPLPLVVLDRARS